jgi:hypothetical protein
MITFDQVIPVISQILQENRAIVEKFEWLVINRDLNGKIRFIIDRKFESDFDTNHEHWLEEVCRAIEPHGYPPKQMVLFESSRDAAIQRRPHFALGDAGDVTVVDRLLFESDWTSIAPEAEGVSRMVFFSIKGGVGRSTALAMAAWALAEEGKSVLILDLDLESPGISTSLLPSEHCPAYGVTDWLMEDLVDNGEAVFDYMTALSGISNNGEVRVVPAYGKETGEYIAKLGRAWMPRQDRDGTQKPWHERLNRLIHQLEQTWKPDVILIDSRAGIDEVSAACVSCLGAKNIFLFGIDGEQTWVGYKILFQHWNKYGSSLHIRNRLQMVGAMIQKDNGPEYFKELNGKAYTVFSEELYDPIPAGKPIGDNFNFDSDDEEAPHVPVIIYWNRNIAALSNLHIIHESLRDQIKIDFGKFIERVKRYV